MLNDIKFALLPYEPGYYWAPKAHKMTWMDDIGTIVWESEDLPVKMAIMNIKDIIKYVQEHPGMDKKSRCALMRIIDERFPLKERVGINQWDLVIFADLDMIHSLLFGNLPADKAQLFYEQLDYALQNICPNNYFYIEHSSSGVGIHCMFYFDCEPTQENYDKFAQYIYEVFRYKVDEYIAKFSSIFTDTDGHAVFDDVYKRPYQKLYITTKDYKLHNVSGYCDDIDVKVEQKQIENDIQNGTFDVKYINKKKKWDTDYYNRLYILTALKKYVGDYDKVEKLWYDFCEDITLYKHYTTQNFKNMLEQNWDKIKAETGHITTLKKYGFNVNDNELHLWLKDNEYIYDYVDTILKFCDNGINLLNSGTGTGKTEVWKQWFNSITDNIMEIGYHKPILIVEPMNSIITTKYDSDNFEIITGSKRINFDGNVKCYVTNYNHLIKQDIDGFKLRDDIEDFFGQFEFVIIDESHIMMKDTFRSDVLIPFLQTLNKIKSTKIIIQTATTMNERSVLNIQKSIVVHKKEKSNVKIIYRQADEGFNIGQIICLVNYYVSNNKKVYIYWNNGSLQNMKFIKKIYPDSIIVYHKRNTGDLEMEKINSDHIFGDYKVMISSVYFGVGNDLNDEIDNAAVIVIGNNTWQEDIQAKGRWRNAKNIEMCIISLPGQKEFMENTKNSSFDWSKRYEANKYILNNLYDDMFNRDKSVIIGNKTYYLKDKEYIHYFAAMKTANEYHSQVYIKNQEFKKLGYDVRETIKPLLTNNTWEAELKQHRQNIKDIRNENFSDFLNGKYNWEEINKDSTLERCAKIIKKMQSKGLLRYCDLDKFIKSKILRYSTFLKYYNKSILDENDLAELFSILWTRNRLKDKSNKTYKIGDVELPEVDYMKLCGYLIWLIYRNKNEGVQLIKSNYYVDFCKQVDDFVHLEDDLINRIFVQNAYSPEYNHFIEEFLGYKIDEDKSIDQDNLIDYIVKLDVDEDYLSKVVTDIVTNIRDKQTKGKIGGKIGTPKKSCTVTDKFKFLDKYNLIVGQTFDSQDSLAAYCDTNKNTISKWRSKGWIE